MSSQTIYENTEATEPAKKEQKKAFVSGSKTLTPPIQKLLNVYVSDLLASRKRYTPIFVDEMASRLARFYETIRKVVDWKDDNALRRNAIERILKRRLFSKIAGFAVRSIDPSILAERLTLELIRGGHLPNGTIPQDRVAVLAKALNKYLFILEENGASQKITDVKDKINYATFIVEIAACEIEEILTNPVKEYGLMEAMAELLDERIDVLPEDAISKEQKKRYIFISAYRNLYGLDDNFIIYRLLSQDHKDWQTPSKEKMVSLSKSLPLDWENISKELKDMSGRKFDRIAERIDTVFMLLGDILEELKDSPEEVVKTFEDKEKLKALVSAAYDKRYLTLKKRLFRLAIFSTLSVFLSNWVTFYIIEVPLANLFYEGFNLIAAAVDFLIPTVIMYLLVSIIRPPRESNAKKVIKETFGFVYQNEASAGYQIHFFRRASNLSRTILSGLYLMITILVFWGIAYIFYFAKLPFTSVIFDTFTIALTVFAAVSIANKARELSVEEHAGAKDFFLDSISVPIAQVGSFLAAKWKEYNIVAIFFTFIVETPLVFILNFVQDWSEYIKERRSEVR